jgi:hypothetical protein
MSDQIDDVFNKIQAILIKTWEETGFGELEIDSTKIGKDKIQVIIKGGIFYKYVINLEDVINCKKDE